MDPRVEGDPERVGGFVPALGFHWLTGLYDPVIAWTTRERRFKQLLLTQAGLAPGSRVLDLGCGTGTLALWARAAQPAAWLTGLDVDPVMLGRARTKLRRARTPVPLIRAYADRLPYADASFDCVLSSLFFHHLAADERRRTLRELLRVLRPAAELHVADWGQPVGAWMQVLSVSIRLLDGAANTADNLAGRIPVLLREAGFVEVATRDQLSTLYGTLALYSARRPR